ncbi:MAG: Hint domain-containing protein [Oligoflexales bacterium]
MNPAFLSSIFTFILIIVGCGDSTYGGGKLCLPEGTPISTPNGDITIEKLKIADLVFSFDLEKNEKVIGVVDDIISHETQSMIQINLNNGTQIDATEDHLFYLPLEKKWEKAGSLKESDNLLLEDKIQPTSVLSIRHIKNEKPIKVFNLKVRHFENSFAFKVLNHSY